MNEINILWADDEIELLKPHVLFLIDKGYSVKTVTNGRDAVELMRKEFFDIIFLDENMPGLSGIETLMEIKNIRSEIPVVMITKSEEENLMEDAIGSKIADYLIKPVNPRQILSTLKKLTDHKRLVSAKTNQAYQQGFQALAMELNDVRNWDDWVEAYKKLVFWELELEKLEDNSMQEILASQKFEANQLFSKYIEKNYSSWMVGKANPPILSPALLTKKVFPKIQENIPTFFVLIDNLRYDQWKIIHPVISEYFRLEEEELFCSILPTATQYSRNAIFSGMMPTEMEKKYPDKWKNDDDEEGKNMFEEFFLEENLKRNKISSKFSYHKITTNEAAKQLSDSLHSLYQNSLNVIVYNFVDMLSHARTEMEMIRELASDERAYRSITLSWFQNSPLLEILKKISQKKIKLVIATDHGTIRVKTPSKVIGDRNTNSNLRYKQGKSLNFVAKDVFHIKNPSEIHLPQQFLSTSYIFAKEDFYFVYQNNYSHFANYFNNTFQHGGISLEEMIIPYAAYTSK